MKLLTLLIFLFNCAIAQTMNDVDVDYYKKFIEETLISPKYRKGENLIFDCQNLHLACVNLESLENCIKPNCLRIKSFKTQNECFTQHNLLMSKSNISKFCNKSM